MKILRENDALFRQKNNVAPKPVARWVEVKEAYRRAGLHLLETAENSRSRKDADVYPALFLCRHAVELELKAALGIAYVADHATDLQSKLDEIFRTHDLMKLWRMFAACERLNFIQITHGGKPLTVSTLIERMQSCVEELSAVDPSSMVFRYPVDKQLQSSDFSGISIPNFINVYTNMCDSLAILRKSLEHAVRVDSDPYQEDEEDWLSRLDNERDEVNARLTTDAILREASRASGE
jgi:hypothetical protein